ncbi:class I adenylate-forming enzyme family protein [Pseudorhodobacter ferrugineus]|uniref:class I adenylate-forming enzyme family protein n=1 Tax=Pseudorhodobacter ferrugineus TaxID=77008 RepID=UPI0003B7A076|nr:acyl-CoA synthetase [Pseudorhodobacter ferrugineus]
MILSQTLALPYPALPAAFNLAAHVLARGAALADRPALELLYPDHTEIWTYAKLQSAVAGVASGLVALGLGPGDRVLMRLGNSPDFPVLFLAAITAGLIPVPTSAMLTGPEVAKLCDLVEPALIVVDAGVALPDVPPCPVLPAAALHEMHALPPHPFALGDPNRLAYIIFTSGTSGRPQAVAHAHRAILGRAMMLQGWYGLTAQDRVLHAGAFNWTYTLGTGLMDPWTVGATALIPAPGTGAEALPALLARSKATMFAAAPGVYRQMLRSPLAPLPHLRHGLSAGEALPQATRDAWFAATNTPIYEAFGMSEISTFISGCPDCAAPAGSTGYAQPGRHVAVLDDAGHPAPIGTSGILAVDRNDPGLFLGYYRDAAATKARFAGDWYLTGDTAQMAVDGAITYLGRRDDMMNAGGFRVSPLEVEGVIATLSGITDCAAIEVEVKQGATIIACVYAANAPLAEDVLRQHADRALARYKQPRAYHHLMQLPRNANGKLNRRALRALFAAPETPL